MKVSLNDTVTVRLTPHGAGIYCKWVMPEGQGYRPTPLDRARVDGGATRWQLWELMQVFGPHVGNGALNPFVGMSITVGAGA